MQTRTIGRVTVSAIGLGGMPMSIEGRPDEARSIRTIHAALDAGVTLIDTADAYHLNAGETGHNERLIAKALASYSGDTSEVLVATKGGHLRPGDGSWTLDGSPAHLREAAEASLKALGVDAIGLYQFHRPDPKVPYADSIGALKELLDSGKIRLAGISNANIEQIELARSILGEGNLASVQNEFSPAFRSSEGELRHCAGAGPAQTRRWLGMTHGGPVAQVPAAQVPANAYLLDVREHEEWEAGHAPSALHIPLGELGTRYTELERDRPLYVICRSGNRSGHAAQALAGAGWDASNVSDGMVGWHAAGLPMTAESGQPYVA